MCRNSEQVTKTVYFSCPDCRKTFPLVIKCIPELHIFTDGDCILCSSCGNARRQAEQRRSEIAALQKKINATCIPPEFRAYEQSRGNLEMLDWISANCDRNILLMSEVGTGKTRAMCKVLLDLAKAGRRCFFTSFLELSDQYSGAKKESTTAAQRILKRLLTGYDIVMIDDIDKQNLTDTRGELLYKIFNALYCGTARTHIWVTMNHSGAELMNRFANRDQGAAVLSRIERMKNDDHFAVRKFGVLK